jgi:Low-density lipoprotein receptor repeat class B
LTYFSLLFWADLGASPRILRSRLDGQKRHIVATGLEMLAGLAVDQEADLIFWANQRHIECADLQGDKRKTLVSGLSQPAGLSVLGNYLYWVDLEQQQIRKIHKTRGGDSESASDRITQLTDILAVHAPTKEVSFVFANVKIYSNPCPL